MNRLEKLQSFLKESPEDPFLHFALAKEYEKAGDEQEALARYEQLVREHAQYVGTYYHLGKLRERQGDLDAAKSAYQQGIIVAERAKDSHSASELRGALALIG